MKSHLDWSAYEGGNDFGFGLDPFAATAEPGSGFARAAGTCTGKRQCLSLDPGLMCPSYRATRDERHSTRYRAETLQAAIAGDLGEAAFSGPAVEAAMALCVACKGCKRECPNGVDMALLSVEARARRWAEQGRIPWREHLFAHLPRLAQNLSTWRTPLRFLEALPGARWLRERLLGMSARRPLPLPAARSFLDSQTEAIHGTGDKGEVVLLADTFSNHFEPEIANAALKVLTAAGYRVHLARPAPRARPLCCGRTFLSSGLIENARAEARRTLDTLLPYARRGLPVIGLEPSCLLMLRDEYHALGLGDGVRELARHALLLEEFLAREHAAGRLDLPLQDAQGAHALVHGHCHQKAFGALPAMTQTLGLIPGLRVETIESSCCGMGGAFGYEAEHHSVSMAMGELDLLPAVRKAPVETLLVANGTSCRHQIEDGAGRRARHLAQVLQDALAIEPDPR
jgi:Fe-S oxidoreductase